MKIIFLENDLSLPSGKVRVCELYITYLIKIWRNFLTFCWFFTKTVSPKMNYLPSKCENANKHTFLAEQFNHVQNIGKKFLASLRFRVVGWYFQLFTDYNFTKKIHKIFSELWGFLFFSTFFQCDVFLFWFRQFPGLKWSR